jgi:hypothetical protein
VATKNFYTIDDKDKLFCRCDGTTTSFVDSATVGQVAKDITANGNATQLSLPTGVTSRTAGFFNGTTDYVVVPDSADWDFSDFTMEGFFNWTVNQTSILFSRNSGGNPGFMFYFQSNSLKIYLNNTSVITESFTPTLNTWYHLAVKRSGSTVSMWVDGVQIGSNATYATAVSGTSAIWIGQQEAGGALFFSGWMKEVRFSKVARTVAVPTAQYTSDSDTVLLMHFDSPATSPLAPAIAFDGTGDYLSVADHADWDFSADFTIEGWFKRPSVGLMDLLGNGGSTGWLVTWSNTNVIRFYAASTGTPKLASSGTAPSTNTWYHLALVRDNGTLKCFINGKLDATTASYATAITSNNNLQIGQDPNNASPFTGSMREIRISSSSVGDGGARYATDFTPSQTGFTVDANTKLYIKGDENNGTAGTSILDSSTTPKEVTAVADAKIKYTEDYRSCIFKDETGKFPYPQGSAKVDFFTVSGSGVGYFDGTGDYLTIPDSDDWDMGSGAWDYEFYFRTGTVSTTMTFISQTNVGSYSPMRLELASSKLLLLSSQNGSSWAINDAGDTTLLNNTWYHVACVRSGDVYTVFLNGKSDTTGAITGAYGTYADELNIGRLYAATPQAYNGLLDNIRISKGVARYTTTFNPPEWKRGGNQIMWII